MSLQQAARELMRFLINEFLHPSLIKLAHDAGHLCGGSMEGIAIFVMLAMLP